MKRPEVSALVLQTCDGFIKHMDEAGLEEPERVEAFLRAIENASSRIRGLMEEAADGPDDPTEEQVAAVVECCAQLVRLGAVSCGMLLEFPINAKDLGPLVTLAGRPN